MAQFGKGEHRITENGNGPEPAYFSTFFAESAFFQVNVGTGVVMVLVSSMVGRRNRWALGSSTSQSSNWTGPFTDTAILVATVVFPVPPLPLAMLIII
jgi:hypothetical protein